MLRVRSYGSCGRVVIVLHGGPAAVGEAAPVARGLARQFRVLEPWQRGSGPAPLSVARHVDDLHQLIRSGGLPLFNTSSESQVASGERRAEPPKPALVGESWGAMLALAYAARHPHTVGPLVLVGCGTFDGASRARLQETLHERMDSALRSELDRLSDTCSDEGERMRRYVELTRGLYQVDPLDPPPDPEVQAMPFDVQAHHESWNDMLRLQDQGLYPASFSAIRSAVLMMHGAEDPHPGRLIRDSLVPHIPHLEYHELPRCGHQPWLERQAVTPFFAELTEWLRRHLCEA